MFGDFILLFFISFLLSICILPRSLKKYKGEASSTSSSSTSSSSSEFITGWTWGYASPTTGTIGRSWLTWKYRESSTQARFTSAYGDLEIKKYEAMVSGVMNSESSVIQKYVTISTDDYGSGEGTSVIKYRSSNTVWDQDDDEVDGPTWVLYTTPFIVQHKYFQIMIEAG